MITELPTIRIKTVGGVEVAMIKDIGQAFGSPTQAGRLIGKSVNHIKALLPRLTRTHSITLLRDDNGAMLINLGEFLKAFVETHQYTQES